MKVHQLKAFLEDQPDNADILIGRYAEDTENLLLFEACSPETAKEVVGDHDIMHWVEDESLILFSGEQVG